MSYVVTLFLGIVLGIAVLCVSLSWATSAVESLPAITASFLQYAADGQQQKIDLGHLAIRKSESEQVKQFGAQVIADHETVHQEIRQLAAKGGLQLSRQPNESHAQMKHQLEQLSGDEFDRAYITAMLFEHAKEMKAFEQHALIETNQAVRRWAASAVPLVEEHMAKAKIIASSLSIATGHPRK